MRKTRRRAFLGVVAFSFVLVGGVGMSVFGRKTETVRAEGYYFTDCEVAYAMETEEYDALGICESDTNIDVWGDVTLPAGAEYSLAKTVDIYDTATLTIREGVRISFVRPDDWNGRPLGMTLWDGELRAEGASGRPIVFEKSGDDVDFVLTFERGTATLDHVRIEGGGDGEAQDGQMGWLRRLVDTAYADDYYWFVVPAIRIENAAVTIRHSVFSGSEGADIYMADNVRYGDSVSRPGAASLFVVDSDFDGDTETPAFLGNFLGCDSDDCRQAVTLENDWYGDASGPRVAGHYDRFGKEVLGAANLGGFAATPNVSEPATCEDCASNVLFLPGVKASRLYMGEDDGGEDQLWPPNDFIGNDVADLHFDGDGKSERDVYTRDVLQEVPILGTNIYKSFLADLKRMKTEGTISDYTPFAYDWRQSVMDIVENGTPYPEGVRSPIDELIRLAESSKSGQVTIVAHSNGGLLAKALMVRLEEMGREDLVDRVVLVASPQMGTPVSVLSLLYGHEESVSFLLRQWEAREFAETIPGAFGLLPSAEYLGRSEDPVVSFASGEHADRLVSYRNAYGDDIGDWDELASFLSGEGDGREEPDVKDIDIENVLAPGLLERVASLHRSIDGWTPAETPDIEVIEIAGWGLDTVSGIRYEEKEGTICLPASLSGGLPKCYGNGDYETIYEPVFTVDGDSIVTAPSAHMIPGSDNVKRYWVDLFRSDSWSSVQRKHHSIFEFDGLKKYLSMLIGGEDISILPDFIQSTQPSDYEGMAPRIRMSLYSPLDVHISDDYGNHTGPHEIETENGPVTVLDEDIPGSTYFQFGERKYASFPAGEPVEIELDGYADGAYTLKFEEIRLTEAGEETVSHTTFEYLPTTADTTVTLSIPESGIADLSSLTADIDGDGSADYTVEPVMGGVATLDTTPPETEFTLSGPEGKNGWYLDTVSVTLSASDGPDGNGVASTEYSLDDGTTWETYTEPFTISEEGVHTIAYRSTDQAGNVEETKGAEIRIDRTAPTARIGFDPDTRVITVSGSDALSDVTIERDEEDISPKQKSWRNIFSWIPAQGRNDKTMVRVNVTLSDEAGHVTDIAFTEERKYGTSFTLSNFSVTRDGDVLDASDIYASYQAVPGRWGRGYAYLSSFLRTGSGAMLSWYDGWRNMTWVSVMLDGGEIRREWKRGLVVPSFEVRDNGIEITLE